MYLKYFGLIDYPFQLTPDPEYIYYTEAHLEALNRLRFGFESNSGFIVLTGEVGCGKTTVLRKFISELSGKFAFIFNPRDDFLSLMRQIISEFDIEYDKEQDAIELIELLNNFCIESLAKNERVTIIIDEAQSLSENVLEKIRLITNLETEKKKLLTIILSGQPELDSLIELHNLRQLKQRIGMRFALEPVKFSDIKNYIDHRLSKAGNSNKIHFSKGAISKIFFYSNGVPRLINLICHHALINAFSEGRYEVAAEDIKSIADEFKLEKHKNIAFRPVLILEILLIGVILFLIFALKQDKKKNNILYNTCYFNIKKPVSVHNTNEVEKKVSLNEGIFGKKSEKKESIKAVSKKIIKKKQKKEFKPVIKKIPIKIESKPIPIYLRYWQNKFILSKNNLKPAKYEIITGKLIKDWNISGKKFIQKKGMYSLILDFSKEANGEKKIILSKADKKYILKVYIDSKPPYIPEYEMKSSKEKIIIGFHMLPEKNFNVFLNEKLVKSEYNLEKGSYECIFDANTLKKRKNILEVISSDEAGNESKRKFIFDK